ncbi:DNA polymerase I [Methyloversatilis sp.]|uniref:DNA polymerase I n=1 Tax=Methyloversatilis sp. TaxID=2569862 RepID=UPI0027354CA5|nr:DNA polymerase I [Methyloversatilis sp.]MDP2867260.1 DNA polymerase I [Methyloversatilis sp.]MDP3456741.1 DNA polymerase I [Methyloversatilis sp.]MDP3576977.1 DNA polymerase I [Methyloversatilis sp.]
MPTLLLVDGSSYLYRAFHAMPDLRNAQGEPTGALRGVINMLRRLASDYKADYRACVFDAKGPTFRDDWYPAYKSHRPPMPEELAAQIAPIHDAVRALGWPLLMLDGVEADDVIGTLSAQATARGIDCVISTGDKDLAQLVNRHVTLVNTMSEEKLDEAGVLAKFGVTPAGIVDYLALIGDSVDNVPGVDKCGPKTAVKWMQQYGSLDEIVAHADEIGGKVGENLRAHIPFLPLARQLLTVKCDVELPTPLESLTSNGESAEALRPIYERYGFRGLLEELAKGPKKNVNAPAPAADAGPSTDPEGSHRSQYETLLDWPALERWLAVLDTAAVVSLDTETTSLEPMEAQLVGMSFALEAGVAAYLPLAHCYPDAPVQLPRDEVLARLKPWLESAAHGKLGQNLKYDRHVFANHGIRLAGVVDDTLLESYVLDADRSHSLDALVTRHLGLKVISYDEVTGKGVSRIGFDQVSIDRATDYAAEDADVTLRVHGVLAPRIQADSKLAYIYRDIELPVSQILFEMERTGVLLDVGSLAAQSNELGQKMIDLEARAHAAAKQPFNINSPKQLAEILFEREKLPVIKKTPSGTPSTDEEVLSQLALDYPLPALILEYRSLAKLKGTYTDKLPRMVRADTGRVHTSFSQAVAVTGRLSSVDPNLQNIPVRTAEGRRIRSAFIAPPGHRLVSADYSQIELRIMAHLSQDARLLQAFADGEDVHRATASEVFGVPPDEVSSEQRRYAKVINFGLIYGMSAHGLAKNLGIERAAAAGWIDRYFTRYPGVARYMDETRALAREQGWVETVFGRRLQLPEIRAVQVARRQGAERAAINAPMQGTAADLIKLAMIAVSGWLEREKLGTRLVLQVHDELVLEVPDTEIDLVRERVPALMENVAQLSVPLRVEAGVGLNWDEAH